MKKQLKLMLAILAMSTMMGTATACDQVPEKLGDFWTSITNPSEEEPEVNTYTVTFVDYDGTVLSTETYEEGATVTAPADPTRAADESYTYAFSGWDKTVATVTEDVTYTATYAKTAIEYTVTFKAEGAVVATKTYTVENRETFEAPAVPEKAHYTGAWAEFTLTTGNVEVEAVYTAVTYTVVFKADGKVVSALQYTVENNVISEPEIPEKAGYGAKWESYTLNGGNKEVNAIYTAGVYTVTFKADGVTVGTCDYTVENKEITPPQVPAKPHYTGTWEAYTLETGNVTVNAVYTPVTYTVTFKADGVVVDTETYTVANKNITEPTAPSKDYYTVEWATYELNGGNVEVNAVYTAIEYTVTFKADGDVVDTKTYTYENQNIEEPTVPNKNYYFGYWASYTLNFTNVEVEAQYAPIEYSVTFMADGVQVDKVTYTYENQEVAAPAVPEKDHYTGKWASYTLNFTNQVVEAEYTAIEYTVTFKAGTYSATRTYTVENKTVDVPTVPAKDHYTGKWASYTLDFSDNLVVEAEYEAIQYTVTFKAEGAVVATKKYTIENTTVTNPDVPVKEYYTGEWAAYDLTNGGDVEVLAVYTAINYTVTFLNDDGSEISTATYHGGDTVEVPTATKAADLDYTYTFKSWDKEVKAVTGDATYTAVYTKKAIEYKLTVKKLDGTTEIVTKTVDGVDKAIEDIEEVNGVKVVMKFDGKVQELSDELIMSLYKDTTIEYSYAYSGQANNLVYNASANKIETTGTSGDVYSQVVMNNTVSGDFELSMDVSWSAAAWPITGFEILGKDDEGNNQSIQFLAGRIYVACFANGAFDIGGDATQWEGYPVKGEGKNVKWCKTTNYMNDGVSKFSWADESFGNFDRNTDNKDAFNFRVVVQDGIAYFYVDGIKCHQFNLLKDINSKLDLNSDLEVHILTKKVTNNNGDAKIEMSNWQINDEISTQTITINHLNGTTETLTKTGVKYATAPSKGYNYTSDNGVKITAMVNGVATTLNEEVFKHLADGDTISFSAVTSGGGKLKYNAAENRLEVSNTPQFKNAYSQVAMSDTVSGKNFEISYDVAIHRTSWPATAATIVYKDAQGKEHSIQFIVGRIWVGCEANWSVANTASSTAGENTNLNQKWYRDHKKTGLWDDTAWGVGSNKDGFRQYNVKITVTDGQAQFTISSLDGTIVDKLDKVFNIAEIASAAGTDFDLMQTMEVQLCVRNAEWYNSSEQTVYPEIHISNWNINDIEG